MTQLNDIFIISAVRTAVGDFGGSLKTLSAVDLGTLVVTEAVKRAGISKADVEHVVMGQVMPTGPEDAFLSKTCARRAELPDHVAAFNVNRLCGSGVQAIVSAAQILKLGEAGIAIAAGAESLSNVPFIDKSMRWGSRMGDVTLIDGLVAGFSDPLLHIHMGITAENVAERHCISREEMDALAVTSHQRAARAQAEGRFKEQILPVEIKTRKGVTVFDTDEHVRPETTVEVLAGMRAAFKKDGTITAGNASGINDGAAALVLATGEAVEKHGLKPMARVVSWGQAGVEPDYMGEGPMKAVPIALQRAGLSLDQIDVIESNEAFAAQAAAVAKVLGFDPEKVNPNGSGVSLGHPVGATGCIMTVKAAYELKRIGGRYALITMCIGGGQGIALVIENVQ